MLNLDEHYFKDWQDLFKTCFALSNKYKRVEKGERGDGIIEQYIPLDKSHQTVITVIYFKHSGQLIELTFDNPLTPGYSKMQSREHFYKYDFTPNKSYGPPGLEFIDINVKVIFKQLMLGLKGREEQHYKNGKLIKSNIFIDYNDEPEHPAWTEYFEKRSFWTIFKGIFSKETIDPETSIKTIDLSSVFSGLKISVFNTSP